jgi:hypothetical protein
MTKVQKVQWFAWGLTVLTVVVAFVAWGSFNKWNLEKLSSYQLFPLFGLLAFSLMWSHYIASVARQYFEVDAKALLEYFESTSLMVLVLILAHPGLLTWQLWRDGEGLPPGSDLNYVEPSARWAILFAFTALVVFLIYELRRWHQRHSWWKAVEYATDVAMVLIYFHALKLGSSLMEGWYRSVWYFYGLALVGTFVFTYVRRIQAGKSKKSQDSNKRA